MRLGVLDVGSNTVHLLVVDAHQGARPLPAFKRRAELRLGEHLTTGNRLSDECAAELRDFFDEALLIAEDKGVQELVAFATSAVRDAVNGEELLTSIEAATHVQIRVLPGEDEARLTFLAARRWFGWSSGRLLVLDIGGGSLEIAAGVDEEPDVAVSLALGAGRLTRDWLHSDPPKPDEVRQLRKHVRAEIADAAGAVLRDGQPDHAVATSKTFRQLARIAGAAPSSDGPHIRRHLRHADVIALAQRLPKMTAAERAQLPGVSRGRAPQLAAGAIVADAAMDLLGLAELEICPWALREGVILRRLDTLPPQAVGGRPARQQTSPALSGRRGRRGYPGTMGRAVQRTGIPAAQGRPRGPVVRGCRTGLGAQGDGVRVDRSARVSAGARPGLAHPARSWCGVSGSGPGGSRRARPGRVRPGGSGCGVSRTGVSGPGVSRPDGGWPGGDGRGMDWPAGRWSERARPDRDLPGWQPVRAGRAARARLGCLALGQAGGCGLVNLVVQRASRRLAREQLRDQVAYLGQPPDSLGVL
jgi:exopolyphosphatase / guanosine-5'-triphosphate,3'-diphosphate pyrophosphatase